MDVFSRFLNCTNGSKSRKPSRALEILKNKYTTHQRTFREKWNFFRGGGFVGIILFTGKFSRCIVVRRGIILGKYFFWGCFPRTFSTKFTRSLLITLNVCIFVKSYCSRKSKSCCHNSTLFSLSLLFTLSYYDQLLNSHALLRHH